MKVQELRKMSLTELKNLVTKKKQDITSLKLEFSKGRKEGDIRELRKTKQDLARVLTIINEKVKDEK